MVHLCSTWYPRVVSGFKLDSKIAPKMLVEIFGQPKLASLIDEGFLDIHRNLRSDNVLLSEKGAVDLVKDGKPIFVIRALLFRSFIKGLSSWIGVCQGNYGFM